MTRVKTENPVKKFKFPHVCCVAKCIKKTPKLTKIYDKMIHPETPCNIISEWVKKITFLQWKKYLLWDFLQKVLSTQNDHKFEHNNSTVL